MPSEPDLFAGIYARGATAAQLSDEALLQAMLDVEAALATRVRGRGPDHGRGGRRDRRRVRRRRFDVDALAREAAQHATPVVGLVAALRAAVGEAYAGDVHLGATSQDIIDTALMLVAARALMPLLADAGAVPTRPPRLADAHRRTPMVGRTLLQQALPITFGLRAAAWLSGLDAANGRLKEIRDAELAVQMGGPVGARPPAIAGRVAAELGLAEPALPWQAIRVPAGGAGDRRSGRWRACSPRSPAT